MMREQQTRKSSKKGQRGTAMVEAALVLLPFMAMTMGIVNLGLNFFLIDALQDRAALGARYASLNPSDSAGTTNMLLYGSATGAKEGDSIVPPPGYMGMDASNVSMVRLDVGLPTERVQVGIYGYKLPMFIPGVSPEMIGKPISATVPVETP
jgi:hypothetical protein